MDNNDNKNLIVGQAYHICKRYNINIFSDNNRFYFKYVLIKIINYKYLSNLNKPKNKRLFRHFFIYYFKFFFIIYIYI